MSNFLYPWEEPEQPKTIEEQPKYEPATQEEIEQAFEQMHEEQAQQQQAQQAFDNMFKDSNYYLDKIMKGSFLK